MTTLLSFAPQPLAKALGWTLLHFLWQGAALGLLAWLVLLLLRGASARARYGAACACLVVMVAAPVATFLSFHWPAPAPIGSVVLNVETAGSAASDAPAHAALSRRLRTTLEPTLPWLLTAWATGVLLLSARFLGGWVRVQRLRRRGGAPVPAEWHLVMSRLCRTLKLTRTVRLLQSTAVEVPTAFGWLRPVILLPACALTGLAPLQLEAILAHELAHIRRGDFPVNLLQSLVEVLLFYHPAVWWLSGRIRAERELCCDDVAAELCGDPLILARALTDLEALREPLAPLPSHLALAANGGSLMHRIRHLLHPALPITSGARVTALGLLAASLLGAAGVAFQEKVSEAPPRPGQPPPSEVQGAKRNLEIQVQGDVKLNGEAADPVAVSGAGSFKVVEKKGGKSRAYAATKDQATYTVDGQVRPLDKEGKDWLRDVIRQVKREPAGRHGERVVELEVRRRQDLESQARDLECRALELESQAQSMSSGERERLHAELDRARAGLDKARAEDRRLHIQVLGAEGGDPGTLVIKRDGDHERVIVKRLQVKQGEGPVEEEVTLPGRDQDIHIPEIHLSRIRVHAFAHPGEGDPRLEMAEIQAELEALQARLDQLQQQLATAPKPPRPPKPPVAPRTVHPVSPPPPAPEALPETPAPPAS